MQDERGKDPSEFTFVIGGARSGKSAFAQGLALKAQGPRVYLATAEPLDAEMAERIAVHRLSRGDGWITIEEPLDPASRIIELKMELGSGVVLIDCITLWITNLLGAGRSDSQILNAVDGLVRACGHTAARVVMVSNEVGNGIVPENALARRFRDIAGAANQRLAAASDAAYLLAAGIPLRLK